MIFAADSMLALLADHVAEHCPGERRDRWLIAGSVPGRPVPRATLTSAWRRACLAAGISGVVLHDLRHYYVSGLIAAGCDVVTVQRALGHAKATTTLGTYAHLWPTAEDRTRAAAEGLALASLAISWYCVRTARVLQRSDVWKRVQRHFHRKWTNTRPKLSLSFSTRW
jgi:hypothetical protein